MKDCDQVLAALRLPRRHHNVLRAYAASRGLTFSRLVRLALADFLRSDPVRALPK
jgi:hypothetical protein